MAKKLLIVESPAKAKTLGKYLGPDYTIKASMGHIRDLPGKELAIDIEKAFKPKYEIIPSKKKTVDDLRKAASQVDEVLLATDPDREGEAIAWHIAYILGKRAPNIKRVMFNEITKPAVLKAVANPGVVDINRVDAQQARRVLDRLVGYLVSEQLWKLITYGLSAGRVQSVALRLIVEREAEIDAFVPQEYWNVRAFAELEQTEKFLVKLAKMGGKDTEIPNKEIADQVLSDLTTKPARLFDVKHRETKQNPNAPFTTSTLQQEASRRLHMGVKRTMGVAQKLYEGRELGKSGAVGLITYMRTDSTRISPVAVKSLREFIASTYGNDYLCTKARQFNPKKGKKTQDAHEAIRPTDVNWTPEKVKPFLERDQFRLYELIWNRFAATQMAEARYKGVTVDVGVGEEGAAPAGFEKGKTGQPAYLLRAVGRKLVFPGFRKLWGETEEEDTRPKKNEETLIELPEIFYATSGAIPTAGADVTVSDVEGEQKFTQPPARYSESMLVKTLDELGIGRPSTYAQIISTISERKYVDRDEKRKLFPTDLGKKVTEILVKEFESVFNVKFTASMEEELDAVEDGGVKWTDTVQRFWEPFQERIASVKGRQTEIKKDSMTKTGRTCPECGEGELVERWGRFGKFVSCNRYPECKFIEKTDGNGEKKAEPESTGRMCPKCEKNELVIRAGRFGKFIACSGYPKCKYTEKIEGEEGKNPALPDISIPCPREGCGGTIVPKMTRRGKLFFSCTNWKDKECKVAFWDEPVEKECPVCGYPLLTKKAKSYVCPECKAKVSYEDDEVIETKSAKKTTAKKTTTKKTAAKKTTKPKKATTKKATTKKTKSDDEGSDA